MKKYCKVKQQQQQQTTTTIRIAIIGLTEIDEQQQ